MSERKLPDIESNFAGWYQEVVTKAKLAEHAPVKGCMIIRPYGYAIWENIKSALDQRIKENGAQNVCFPMFIPESYLAREKDHVEGFSPEIAVVTHAGGADLKEKLVVRPTSETIIHESMSRWIQSYRDLPLKINQWCNVVRWEKHPRLFLRTSEFQWQEGHTAHATEQEAREQVEDILREYDIFSRYVLAIPVVTGKKSEKEKFAGAVDSYSIEGLMPDGKALQMGTVHYLGENFSRMFGVDFLDQDGERKFVHMTSWGVSTRLIGALIMVHGDNKGLVLPPKVAPTQVVIVPIGGKTEGEQANAYKEALKIEGFLRKRGIRVEIDERDIRPGAKFYEHEIRGVPLRLEIGKNEIRDRTVSYTIRYNSERGVLQMRNDMGVDVMEILDKIQRDMYDNAKKKLAERKIITRDKNSFESLLKEQSGMICTPWCCETECEMAIKEATGAVSRNILTDWKIGENDEKCIYCGKPTKAWACFAKSY